jgi:hypothetical protein
MSRSSRTGTLNHPAETRNAILDRLSRDELTVAQALERRGNEKTS